MGLFSVRDRELGVRGENGRRKRTTNKWLDPTPVGDVNSSARTGSAWSVQAHVKCERSGGAHKPWSVRRARD